jgi:hypothetical protein
MNLREITIKHGRLIVFIRQKLAEIYFGFTLGIGTLKTMARTSVFACVVCALKRPIKNFLAQKALF